MQIHYIDTDEEITSIVDRLRKSKSAENYFVVPQRSMVFQSLVNLRLLDLEAKKNRKKAALVTQNNLIGSLAKKAGIETRLSADGLDARKEERRLAATTVTEEESKSKERVDISRLITREVDKEKRLASLGTEDYFTPTPKPAGRPSMKEADKSLVRGFTGEEKKEGKREEPARFSIRKKEPEKYIPSAPAPLKSAVMSDMLPEKEPEKIREDYVTEKTFPESPISQRTEEQIKSFFSDTGTKENETADVSVKKEAKERKTVSGKFKKIILVFSAASFLLALSVILYLVVPRAEIKVFPKYESREISFNFSGSVKLSEPDQGAKIIPARIIEDEETLSESFAATGRGASSGGKARGKVVIFNNYSSASQPLIATTRLLSREGKLFRLVKGVTVPGMTQVGGETKPGAIEAEVIADEAGEGFNIAPSRFSIPGFEGGPKYDKFYAQSEKPMAGGGSGANQDVSLSQEDINGAKQKIENSLKEKVSKKLVSGLKDKEIIIPGSEEIVIPESTPVGRVGDLKENFEYQARAKARAFAISEQQLKNLIGGQIKGQSNELSNLALKSMDVEYRQADANFDEGLVAVKTEAEALYLPSFDLEALKNSFLGKNENQIREILKSHSEVDRVEINFWPTFVSSRVPPFGRQVKVMLEDNVN